MRKLRHAAVGWEGCYPLLTLKAAVPKLALTAGCTLPKSAPVNLTVEERLGINREGHLDVATRIPRPCQVHRPLDALGRNRHPETSSAADHLKGDPNHACPTY